MIGKQTTTLFHRLVFAIGCLMVPLGATAESIRATVVAADPAANTLTLEDDQVVRVTTGDARIGYVGREIIGELDAATEPATLYGIWPNDAVDRKVARDVNRKLNDDTITLGRKAFRSLGDYIPDFALYDQEGNLVRKATLKGKNVVFNFIFTRCEMPNMCPASTARMMMLQKMIDKEGLRDAQIVTITFDPEYDTPGILNEYARQRGAHFKNMRLLTGNPTAIDNLMKQFGILTIEEDGTINHTMATVLIDKFGKVVYRKEGSIWSPYEFFDKLKEREEN
ncbi:MAG: SCO family protein [Verrucomicrobiota bacterium]